MVSKSLGGGQALARGALVAGVKLVASYPGSPSSEVVEELLGLAGGHGIYVEWSTNEKVAMELGIGASIAGRRALVCTKSVGMNAMIDPLMALNLTPVNGGLVILLGDDPGGYGSQNDQDSRPLSVMLEMPMMEPATPAEGLAMMEEAFLISERLHTAVIIRETRSYTRRRGPVELRAVPVDQPDLGIVREPWRFVPVPRNVVAKHRALHERFEGFTRWANGSPFNKIFGQGPRGILGSGHAYQKLMDVLGEGPPDGLRVLKLATIHPLADEVVARFLEGCDEVLVVEENEPFLENQIKAVAHDREIQVKVLGKLTGSIHREGELYRWQIQEALSRWVPGFVPARNYSQEDEAGERPQQKNNCAGCRFGEILDVLEEVSRDLGQRPFLVGDPGCLVTVAERMEAKFAIGSAVAVASGLSKAGIGERSIALFGDSSFFHTSLPAIVNAVWNQSDIIMIVLDNGSTVTSGFQPNPAVGKNAMGQPAPALSMERIASACGVEWVRRFRRTDPPDTLRGLFRQALTRRGLGLLVLETPCDRVS